MKVILFQPQIPQNTGNIIRTCSATGAELVLVHPLGFSTANRHMKRAGLGYLPDVTIEEIFDLESYLTNSSHPFYFFSSKATQVYTDATFTQESFFIFGSETSGLPAHFLEKWEDRFLTIPMRSSTRCLNLATSVAIVLYEAIRQTTLPQGSSL